MGYSKQQLLARLQDKKNRFFIVSALADTKVDLKALLSQRLGLGKGGVRMAPEDALGEILQVALGCVTPFALVNESTRDVSLLLDQGFKTQEHCCFHPLSNDMSISLNASGLDKFLKSISREPLYVDLEANPTVGKDQLPDLAALVPTGSIVLPDQPEKPPSSKVPIDGKHISADDKSKVVPAKAAKPSSSEKNTKGKPAHDVPPSSPFADVEKFVDEILHKTSTLLHSQTKEETIKQHGEQLGTMVSDNQRKTLSSDLKNFAINDI